MESGRSRQTELNETSLLSSCDYTSYCNFFLAVAFFTVGTVVIVWAQNEVRMMSVLGHMWLVGPFLISLGLIYSVKTVLYLRKKKLITIINRQQALLTEVQGSLLINQQQLIVRNPSALILPPDYDLVAGQGDQRIALPKNQSTATAIEEQTPPTYEEAIRQHHQTNR